MSQVGQPKQTFCKHGLGSRICTLKKSRGWMMEVAIIPAMPPNTNGFADSHTDRPLLSKVCSIIWLFSFILHKLPPALNYTS